MYICTMKFDKKKAAFWVIMAALVLIGIILLLGAGKKTDHPSAASAAISVRTEKGRVAYLTDCGWEVESPALNEAAVVIPRSFSKVFEAYNDLQKQQGFDLSQYCGEEVTLYTYRVLNCDRSDHVLASLYVFRGEVIGGDVHSTELDGLCAV